MMSNHLKGLSNTKIYRKYRSMLERCKNPNHRSYMEYGGRGIIICDEWLNDYSAFRKWSMENGYKDNGELSIDRIDNNGNYEPNNCRWVDIKIQANNKSSNITITHNGKTQTLQQWSEETGIGVDNLYYRYRVGKTPEEILRKYDVKNIGCTRVDVTEEKVLELKKQGMSITKIANVLGCSEGTVRNRLTKRGGRK